jgi:thioredoxin reductase (NADPH)
MEEAIHLSKFGSQITIIVRTDTLRASKIMIERAQSNPKIQFLYWTEIQEVYGNDKLIQGIKIKNNQSGMLTDLSC